MHRLLHLWLVTFLVLFTAVACGVQLTRPVDPAASHEIPAFAIPPANPGVAYERFIVIGDTGTGRADQYKVAAAMAERANRDGLAFILMLGDNFYENGVQSVDDPQWKTKFEDVYADPALQVPVYAVLGNHDYRGNIQAQIDYTRRSERWRMPAAYYTFTRHLGDGTRIQFFAIDSNPIHNREADAPAQLAWLDRELGKSDARWKIVFGHHTLYSHSIRGYNETMIAQIEPLLTRHKVDLYLAGHDHTLEMHKPVKGVNYVVSGGGAGPDKAYRVEWSDESYYAATLGGFVFIRASKDELVIEFVRQDAKTQYAHVIAK